jgi:hypothetical protein
MSSVKYLGIHSGLQGSTLLSEAIAGCTWIYVVSKTDVRHISLGRRSILPMLSAMGGYCKGRFVCVCVSELINHFDIQLYVKLKEAVPTTRHGT